MQGRLSLLIAGIALAVGGGVAGAVVVAPSLQSDASPVALRHAASKQPQATPQHTFHVAKKARGMARGARQLANSLVDQVSQAQSDATQALGTADTALSTINATKTASDSVSGQASSTTADFARDPASVGPQVTVTVPESGLVQIFASAHIDSAEGAVGLFEDGQLVDLGDQGGGAFCEIEDSIFMTLLGPVSVSTPPSADGGPMCGTVGNAGSPLLFRRAPGTHTYELRYADCGCDPGPSLFSDRTLQVSPQL